MSQIPLWFSHFDRVPKQDGQIDCQTHALCSKNSCTATCFLCFWLLRCSSLSSVIYRTFEFYLTYC